MIGIVANVKHWHGAAPDSWFSHLAMEVAGEETSAEWLEAVDDETYGNVGCGGNCDGSKFENHRFAYCDKNECKPGFYYLEGLCLNCSLLFPGCKNCYSTEIQIADNQIDYNFTCQECLSNQYKKNEFGVCQKCEM